MKFVTLDFETYYDHEYSLSKMSTEEYITDPRFEVILVSAKVNNEPTIWATGTRAQLQSWLNALELGKHAVCAHHNRFDGLILAEIFGIIPAMYVDTLQMAQALLRPYLPRCSLSECLKALTLGTKGTEVENMRGRTRQSLSSGELLRYAAYCVNDTERTYDLFKRLALRFPPAEFHIMDLTHRMYMLPRFELDATMCAENLQEAQAKKAQLLASLPPEVQKADLMSNPRFAELLTTLGVEVPFKISTATGKATFAFAKSDAGYKQMQEDYADHPVLSAILTARLGVKSTIEETRCQRLLDIAVRHKKFRVPINYHAAHTGRDGGTEGLNAQNFPRIDKSRMRFSIRAPKDHVVLSADLAQIEARLTSWLSGCTTQTNKWAAKVDLYADFITVATGESTVKGRSKADDKRRFIGKTCILGLGFGMGPPKLKTSLFGYGVPITLPEAHRYVSTYRSIYSEIPELWTTFDRSIRGVMCVKGAQQQVGPLTLKHRSILLPNGMPLTYNNLRWIDTDKYSGWAYTFGAETRTLWGGKVAENVVQALARGIIMDGMLTIEDEVGIIPALRQHDELDFVVPARDAESIAKAVREILVCSPTWAPGLPLDVEINYGESLGDCK